MTDVAGGRKAENAPGSEARRLLLVAGSVLATFGGGALAIALLVWLRQAGLLHAQLGGGAVLGVFCVGCLAGSLSFRRALDRTEHVPAATPELLADTLEELRAPVVTPATITLWPLLLISVAVFAGTGGASRGVENILLLIGVLALHEGGHLVAMRALGYRDTRILFVPFLGAATTGKRENVSGNERAIVLLAGPLPGLLLGIALLFSNSAHDPLLRHAAGMLVAINGFNLLPLGVLDGGKLLDVLLFGQSPWQSAAFTLVSSALLAVIALVFHSWLLAAVGVISMVMAPTSYAVAKAASGLRSKMPLPTSLSAASPEVLDELFAAAYESLPAHMKRVKRAKQLPARCATAMRLILGRMAQRPASITVSALILGGYGAFFALAMTVWLRHR
jgi:Zn-dependent protease